MYGIMWKYLFIVVGYLGFVQCETLRKFRFQDYCGTSINDEAGSLQFDSSGYSSDFPGNKCNVIIHIMSGRQLMFYFEEFLLSINCEDTNLTITHGDIYSKTTVPGLSKYLCGKNRTIEQTDQNFTASGDRVTITYNYSNIGKNFPGTFHIKFVNFHKGACDGDNEYQCLNEYCVNKSYHCSDEIRACPSDELDCETLATLEDLVDFAVEILRNVGWVIFIAIVIIVLRFLLVKFKPSLCRLIQQNSPNERQNSRAENTYSDSLQIEEVTSNTPCPLAEPEQTNDSTDTYSRNSNLRVSLEDVTVTSSDDVTSPFAQPTAPPPSYEDAVAPSYDEVMANENIYKHSRP